MIVGGQHAKNKFPPSVSPPLSSAWEIIDWFRILCLFRILIHLITLQIPAGEVAKQRRMTYESSESKCRWTNGMIKRWATTAAKILLTLAAIWYLQKKVDLAAAWDVGKSLSLWWFLLALGLQCLQTFVCGGRWWMVLRSLGARMPFLMSVELFMIGFFFGQVLPGAVGGDAVRIWKTREAGLSLSHSINSVLLERVITVFALMLLAAVCQPFLQMDLNNLLPIWLLPAVAFMGFCGLIVLLLLDKLPGNLGHIRLVRGFFALAVDGRKLFLSLRQVLPTLLVTILGHVNLVLIMWALGRGIGAPVTIGECLVLVPPIILAATLPISISGWGVRENMTVVLFAGIGVTHEQSAAISLLFGLIGLLVSLPGGQFWLRERNLPGLEMQAEEVEDFLPALDGSDQA